MATPWHQMCVAGILGKQWPSRWQTSGHACVRKYWSTQQSDHCLAYSTKLTWNNINFKNLQCIISEFLHYMTCQTFISSLRSIYWYKNYFTLYYSKNELFRTRRSDSIKQKTIRRKLTNRNKKIQKRHTPKTFLCRPTARFRRIQPKNIHQIKI